MRTVKEILEGVTAGGKWRVPPDQLQINSNYVVEAQGDEIIECYYELDAAYCARAASTWPELVQALGELRDAIRDGTPLLIPCAKATRVLEEALK